MVPTFALRYSGFAQRGPMTGRSTTNDLIVIAGAGGFVGGSLARYFHNRGARRIRAVDKKPTAEWYQRIPEAESLCLDLSREADCRRAVDGAVEVYNLAADMGGMGFIERFRVECMRNILINTHLIEAASAAGVARYFFASSACVYNAALQNDPNVVALKEADAYPAMPERGYGWEKLMGEMFSRCWANAALKTAVARTCTTSTVRTSSWDGGRERLRPPSVARSSTPSSAAVAVIWGDGTATRSFTHRRLRQRHRPHHPQRCAHRHAGQSRISESSRSATWYRSRRIAGVKLEREYDLSAPRGVAGRNSDNTFIKKMLDWSRTTPDAGLAATYRWIQTQYRAQHPQRMRSKQASDKTGKTRRLLGLHTRQQDGPTAGAPLVELNAVRSSTGTHTFIIFNTFCCHYLSEYLSAL
jgi:nucleoside-diphosphate-sugar epimerase